MADRQLHGIFGLIVKFVSVERMIKAAYDKFGTFYTDGSIDMKDDKNVTIEISGIKQTDEHSTQLQHYLKRLAEIGTRKSVSCRKVKINDLKYNYVLQVEDYPYQ